MLVAVLCVMVVRDDGGAGVDDDVLMMSVLVGDRCTGAADVHIVFE